MPLPEPPIAQRRRVAWARTLSLGLVAGLLGGAACGGTGTVSTPDRMCLPPYLGNDDPRTHPDGASLCPSGPGICNYQTQAGCGPTAACAPHIDNMAATVTPACLQGGAQKKGDDCDNKTTICERGLVCINPKPPVPGKCRKLCCGGDWSVCDPGESCLRQANAQILSTTGAVIATIDAGLDTCSVINDCDVLDPQSCQSQGRICRIVDPPGSVACMPFSTLKLGDTCDADHQCGPVMHCVGSSATDPKTCRQLCPWAKCTDPKCPSDSDTCVHFHRDPKGVGECTPGWRGSPFGSWADAGAAAAADAAP